ncbi:MAG TPA: hypothetical protein VFN74_06885 [Chloroflexota bacterium]|nr:hypothetical protein [Chloroflexota bacterium]
MPVEAALVAGAERVGQRLWLLHLEAPGIAPLVRAGQWVMVRCAEVDVPVWDPYLPRAFFVFAVDRAAGRMSVLVERRGRGSAWLSGRREGDRVLAHGPVGREVREAKLTRHLLLLAEGTVGLTALSLMAADASSRKVSVTLVRNAASGEDEPPPHLLPPDVEYRATTPEAGGLLGGLAPLLAWADEVMVAAAAPLLDTLQALRRTRLAPFTMHSQLPVQALPLPEWGRAGGGDALPCGTGACGACQVRTRERQRLFCLDGPAFALEDLRWEDEESAAV